jgi:hypothetical protein
MRTISEFTRTQRLKSGAGPLKAVSHVLGAPRFSPYRSLAAIPTSVLASQENTSI